jgi:putative phosphoribosyl transferase
MIQQRFPNRIAAGRRLAELLFDYCDRPDTLVLALPRGGVPVAFEIAEKLNLPLDVYLVRKLGAPTNPEVAIGAIAMDGTIITNDSVVSRLFITPKQFNKILKKEQNELARRAIVYRDNEPLPDISKKTIILVDDGIATGATIDAAIMALKEHNPATLIVAVPVAAREAYNELSKKVDKIVCGFIPKFFYSVGLWYDNFKQISDAQVVELLKKLKNSRTKIKGTQLVNIS